MAERSVRPRDCALAFALPLDRDELLADQDPAVPKDFAKGVRPAAYEPIAEFALETIAEARALGATVVERATLDDLRAALCRFHVVTVFAHACFVDIAPSDLVDPIALLDRVRGGGDPLSRLVAARFVAASLDPEALRQRMALELNQLVEPTRAFYEMTPTEARRRAARLDALDPGTPRITRALLEEAFPAHLRPAPSVELWDRLRTVAEVVAAVPEGFGGVLELSICNSVIIGEQIKRRHRGCRVLANEMLAPLAFRLGIYALTLREVAQGEGRLSYTEAMLRVREALRGETI